MSRSKKPPNGWARILALLVSLCLLLAGLYCFAGCISVPKAEVASPAVVDGNVDSEVDVSEGQTTTSSESGPAITIKNEVNGKAPYVLGGSVTLSGVLGVCVWWRRRAAGLEALLKSWSVALARYRASVDKETWKPVADMLIDQVDRDGTRADHDRIYQWTWRRR